MKRLVYGIVSSLIIVSVAVPATAKTPTFVIAQQDATIQRMFRELRVVTEDMQEMMTQMKMMMAEMKALTSVPSGKPTTTNDLYRQQQVLIQQMEILIGRTRLGTIQPRTISTSTVQEVQQQQQVMMTEMKEMMAEMKRMMAAYRGRATDRR
ncbi:hypothetical protein JOY44_25390 (plasmid) [Phormidium sp. CLA17]|uniref:hypothetical protein n=1 Tax=Leptolyngbya sp. Cla-17 TaxID=2803751 RepID=UPI001492BC28|nr:hypothetical protein [Leptolyngbya sp. Cla-17]MBM0744858.1 hypothetical protein [Leptolyngbya sp. Cla-17]